MYLIFWFLGCERVSWCGSPQMCTSMYYLRNRLLQDILIIALHDHLTSWSHKESLCKHGNKLLSFSICFCVVSMIMNIFAIYHREVTPYPPSPWTSDNHICGISIDHIHIGLCFHLSYLFANKLFCIKSRCLPCLLKIYVLYSNKILV